MIKEKIMQGMLILVLLTPTLLAVSITIDIKESFGIGETISFNYDITSDTNKEIQYIASVNCPNAPLPLLELIEDTTPITETYTYLKVNELTEPQICTAIVGVLEPSEIIEKKTFEIIANPSFKVEIETCKDQSCSEKSKIFIQGENVYLAYSSEVEDAEITAILIYPDKSTKQLSLPTSIKAKKIGTYDLEVTASKEGYKSVTKKIQFGVIDGEVVIEETDKISYEKELEFWNRDFFKEPRYLIYLLGVVIVLFILIFLIIHLFSRMKKKKRRNHSLE